MRNLQRNARGAGKELLGTLFARSEYVEVHFENVGCVVIVEDVIYKKKELPEME